MEPNEAFKPREIEILHLMVEGLSNREIADRLYIGVETVRWYAKEIYSKLAVSGRKEAAQKAKLLGLLPGQPASVAEQLAISQPQRAQFLSMARSQFVATAPPTDALRLPPYLAAPPDQSPSRFVGRQRELAQLHAHLDQALAGHSRIVFVCGEAGRGKTSLLAEFARQAQRSRSDLIVVAGTCSAHGDIGTPYLPFRDVLALLTGDLETQMAAGVVLPEQAQRLWALLPHTLQTIVEQGPSLLTMLVAGPELAKRVAQYATGQPAWLAQLQEVIIQQQARPAHLEQNQLFEQIRRVLQALAAQQPVLVLLDDLQWIDAASFHLLFHLGRRFERDRILLLGAYRASEVNDSHPLAPVITEFKRRFGDIQLDLEQFDPVESRAFFDALLDIESIRLGESFRERLFWHTKGYPLFTIELLRHLQERGNLIQDKDGQWFARVALEAGDLPVRIEAVIDQRLSHLEPALLELLRTAAVEGEIFNAQVAAHVLQLDERLILQQLSRLEQDHWLVREHSEIAVDGRYLNRYQFSHILFQHYLYRQLSQGERRLLHRAVAEALLALYQPQTGDIAVQLAHHYTQAKAQTEAALYLRMAGDQAMQGAALEQAIHYYRAALDGWPADDEAWRAETLRKLGECLWMMGQMSAGLEALHACYAVYEMLGNRIGASAVQHLIGRITWERGERASALHHYHLALSILESEPESVELAQAMSAISQMHMLASEYEQAIAWGERALALARRLDAQEVVAHAWDNLGVALAASANPERGLALMQESIRLAFALHMPHEACRAHVNLGEALAWHGRYAEAEEIFDNLLPYATQTGMAIFEGVALVRLTGLDWQQGRWSAAMRRRQKIARWRAEFRGATVPKVWASTLLGWIYSDLGLPHLARQELERELNTARTLDEARTVVPHLGLLARSLAVLGQEEEVAALIEECLTLQKRTPFDHAYTIAPLLFAFRWSAQGRVTAESRKAVEDCLYHLERIEGQFQSMESIAALAEARGIKALHNEQSAVAVEQLRQAAAAWANLNRPYDQARVLNDLGRDLLQLGDSRQAYSAFNEAGSLIETLAAQLEDAELRSSFQNSEMVQEIQTGRWLAAAPHPG